MNNLTQTILAMASGVLPLVPIVMGLVQWVKTTFNTSHAGLLNGLAMLFGIVLGGGFMLAQSVPDSFAGWFIDVIYGVVLGLTASGLFKVGQQMSATPLTNVSTTTTTTTVEAVTQGAETAKAVSEQVSPPASPAVPDNRERK